MSLNPRCPLGLLMGYARTVSKVCRGSMSVAVLEQVKRQPIRLRKQF